MNLLSAINRSPSPAPPPAGAASLSAIADDVVSPFGEMMDELLGAPTPPAPDPAGGDDTSAPSSSAPAPAKTQPNRKKAQTETAVATSFVSGDPATPDPPLGNPDAAVVATAPSGAGQVASASGPPVAPDDSSSGAEATTPDPEAGDLKPTPATHAPKPRNLAAVQALASATPASAKAVAASKVAKPADQAGSLILPNIATAAPAAHSSKTGDFTNRSSKKTPADAPPESGPSATDNPPPPPSGTPPAKQEVDMKEAPELTSFTGSMEQKLPSEAVSAGLQAAALRGDLSITLNGTTATLTLAGANGVAKSESASETNSLAAHDVAAASRWLQQTQQVVAFHAIRLRGNGPAQELHVVIKPDASLQLTIDLHRHNGTVEVQANLDRGDYNLLNRHWADLQQLLEPRGVRLAPLACQDAEAGANANSFQHSEPKEEQPEMTPAPKSMASSLGGLEIPPQVKEALALPRRWESWA